MKGKVQSQSFYFLAELLFVILCFAISSVLCVRLFVAANQKHVQSAQLKEALMKIQPVAELLQTYDETVPLQQALALDTCQQNQCVINFDQDWQETPQVSVYQMLISSTLRGQNRENQIQVFEKAKNRLIVELKPVSLKGNEK